MNAARNPKKNLTLPPVLHCSKLFPNLPIPAFKAPVAATFPMPKSLILGVSSGGYHYNCHCRRAPHEKAKRYVCWLLPFVPEKVVLVGIIIAVVTISVCSSGWANPEAPRQAAEQVLKLTNAHMMLEPMVGEMQRRQLKQLEEMNLSKDTYLITGKNILRKNELIKAELAWDKMEDE